MTTPEILADWDRAEDLGILPAADPDAWWCPECQQPIYVGPPEDACPDCGGFDWQAEIWRGWTS